MKAKSDLAFALLLFLAFVCLVILFHRPVGAPQAAYDGGYPVEWGYPPPVPTTPTTDPWCEEAQLLGLHPPKWCPPEPWPPVIGEAVSTVAGEPQPTETPSVLIKVGGRVKGRP